MKKQATTILELNHEEALNFLMDTQQFCSFELPEYFDFQKVLNFVRTTIAEKPYDDCLSDKRPDDFCDTNMNILMNKYGRYGIRPITLPNPYLYYFMARELCEKTNWMRIKDCFSHFSVPHIKACALPVLPEEKEPFNKATVILNWWNQMEQRSLELSLEYKYMFVTDITNCYGSVNPQTIEALRAPVKP